MARPVPLPLQHSLFPPQPPEKPPQQPAPETTARETLWAALHFPHLSLEVLRPQADDAAWAVIQTHRGQVQVHAVSQAAVVMGVEPGQPLTAAYALCPELNTVTRDEAVEDDSLALLADWAMQYSSIVSPEPQALLIEIGASLKLFGGLLSLRQQMGTALQQLPHRTRLAIAPTPQAALLLARCGIETMVTDTAALRATLGSLPLTALPVTEKQAALLTRLGLRNLRDLWRLPGEGLSKRLGLEFTDYLARLLAYKPEPRPLHQTAPDFSACWPFPIETANTTFILHGIRRLLPGLIRFMRLHDLALDRLQLLFYHPEQKSSRMEIAMQHLCRDEAHLLSLIGDRLEQERLAAPVLELELKADEFHPFVVHEQTLLNHRDETGTDEEWQQLLDQLRTRLGEAAVTTLRLQDDHAPEQAWSYDHGEEEELTSTGPARPLWLLRHPEPLERGSFNLHSEPERIEGGWWDDRDIRRDYYRARDRHGRRLWVFHDLNSDRWYLHGLFG